MPSGLLESPCLAPTTSALLEEARCVLARQFATRFHYLDLASSRLVSSDGKLPLSVQPPAWLEDLVRQADLDEVCVIPVSDSLQVLLIPLGDGAEPTLVAIGIFALGDHRDPADADELVSLLGPEASAEQVPTCSPGLLAQLGRSVLAALAERRELRSRRSELQQLAGHVSRNYEEITLLHQVAREAQISRGARAVQELTLSLLSEVLPVQQLAYVPAGEAEMLSAGQPVLSESQCRELVRFQADRAARRPLVENHVSRQEWGRQFPALHCLVVVAVADGSSRLGWLLALNTNDGSELGTVEASLLGAIAAMLATHQTNVNLFENAQDMFLGVVRALSAAIDAKDPYTRGHSERVARVGAMLAEKLGLPQQQVDLIYLSGLLHDVGKIGVRDAVLRKADKLSDDEFQHIKDHAKIGFEILCGIKQLKPVLPGVRHHHEKFDGTGYPDRLAGEEISIIARILAVADSYDAMSSNRPYRKAMAQEKVEQIIRSGAGQQWDGRVVDAFLSVHDQIRATIGTSDSASSPAASGSADACPTPRPVAPPDLRRIARSLAQLSA